MTAEELVRSQIGALVVENCILRAKVSALEEQLARLRPDDASQS
jgi:hypothetical protein